MLVRALLPKATDTHFERLRERGYQSILKDSGNEGPRAYRKSLHVGQSKSLRYPQTGLNMAGEDSTLKVTKFHGKRGEDFSLFKMRVRSILTGKDLWDVFDPMGIDHSTEEAKKKAAKAWMYIANGLGDVPLRAVCKEVEECPRKIWEELDTRYESTAETAHITVAENLAKKTLKPGGDVVNHMGEIEAMYDRLDKMGDHTSDRTKIAKLLASLPKEYDSISAALRASPAEGRMFTEVQDLLQDEYERMKGSSSNDNGSSKVMYTAEQTKRYNEKRQEKRRLQTIVCFNCGKKGHMEVNSRSRKKDDDNDGKDEKDGSAKRFSGKSKAKKTALG